MSDEIFVASIGKCRNPKNKILVKLISQQGIERHLVECDKLFKTNNGKSLVVDKNLLIKGGE